MGNIRLILHAILVGILKIDRIMRRQKIVVINPAQLEALHRVTSPMLFAPTHCGKYDIQVMGEVLGMHQWALLSGDPHELPGTIEGTWNFSENQPVLPLFRGVVDAASETGALIWKYAYHDRNIITTAEAFEYLQYLIPCRENAFLFRGRNLNYSK